MKAWWVLLVVALVPGTSAGASFRSSFLRFELPKGWRCKLEDTTWTCQATDPARRRDAIIVLAAKLRGQGDSLEQYLAYLRSPRHRVGPNGVELASRVEFARERTLNGLKWIDALQDGSEIPGFLTRYFATVEDDVAVLVTYSVRDDRYQMRLPDFEPFVSSLRIVWRRHHNHSAPKRRR